MENKRFCKFCGEKIDINSVVCPKCGRQLKIIKKTEEVKEKENNIEEASKFYTQSWFMWIMLIFFAPVGIFLMWEFNDKMKKNTKIILSIVFAIFFLILVFGSAGETTVSENPSSSNNNTSSEVNKTKVEVIDFNSMSEDAILTWCNDNNLNCNIKREYSDTVPKDGYIKQSINSGERVVENTTITITYSLGKAPTKAQENATKMATSYLDTMPFSRSGLIEQLEFEGFTHEDAVYGVDNITVDWNEQAVKMATSYLDTMPFSRSGLIEQLEFEGFTHDQAVYGVEQNGL